MVIGLLITSILAGGYVGKTGQYKMFPIAGSAVIALGLFLLSLMDENTSILVTSLYIFIIGLGIGLTMQVLTLVVQNTASYADLGTATSAVTFFRTHDLAFRIRRLRFLARHLADTLESEGAAEDEAVLAMHDAIYRALH